jgi:hypothetical protein
MTKKQGEGVKARYGSVHYSALQDLSRFRFRKSPEVKFACKCYL